MPANITKISRSKGEIHIRTEESKNGDVIKTDVESDQPANPEFGKTFDTLGDYMCKMMEFPTEWKDKADCRTLSINYEDDDERMGAVVTIYVQLSKFNTGICINSPQLREKIPGTAGGGNFMPAKMLDLVKELRDEAQKYLDGDRAQRELLDKGGDEEEDAA